MERVWRTLIAGAVGLALGAGCQGPKSWRDDTQKVPAGIPAAPLSPMVRGDGNTVVPASGTVPAAAPATPALALPAIPGLTGPVAEKKVMPAQILVMWRNRIDFLPDPSPGKNGQLGPGLAGQVFLFDAGMQAATPEGKLTVALYDESPRPPGQPANLPEGWEFDKETLKKLRTNDERFGRSYALFLPWPTYRPDVTRVRIAVRFDPEHGHPLYAEETRITIDTSLPGTPEAGKSWTTTTPPAGFSPLGGPPPAGGLAPVGGPPGPATPVGLSPAPAGFGALPPAPPGYGSLTPPAAAAPPGPVGAAGPMRPGALSASPGGPAAPNGLPPFVTIVPSVGR